jgi:hypothetical protein
MTLIPTNYLTADVRSNFLRSLALLSSITVPSVARPFDTAAGTPAVLVEPGIAKWFQAFSWQTIADGSAFQHTFRAEIPYSAKILGATGNLQKAISPLVTKTIPQWLGTPGTGVAPATAGTLERLAYMQVKEIMGNLVTGESCAMTPRVETISGRSFVEVIGVIKTATNPFEAVTVVSAE